jgi:hypothetical protein
VWDGVTVNGHEEPEAPAFPFDAMSARKNSRHPGYSQWGKFCDLTGLRDFFFEKNYGLMRRHPGTFALTPDHLHRVRVAIGEWQRVYPNAVPGWDYFAEFPGRDDIDDGVRGRDSTLARLLWLEWWIAWALAHCERPAIHNH